MRSMVAMLGAVALLSTVVPAHAQGRVRPRVVARAQRRVRLMIDVGLKASSSKLRETQTFQQYQEQGTFTLARTFPKRPFYDAGAAIHLIGGLHAGASVSYFTAPGAGTLTAQVPHPLFFDQPRTTSGAPSGVDRKELGVHLQLLWTARAADGIEFTAFGGPSLFHTEQGLVTTLNVSVASEVYPYDSLKFPSVTTETVKGQVNGYHAGVDMTWRRGKTLGLGMLISYSHGQKNVTPTGGQAVKIEPGGLHAGGGLRVFF